MCADETKAIAQDASRRLAFELMCIHCGYNLRGLEATGVCSECGKPVVGSMNPSAPRPVRKFVRVTFWMIVAGYCLFGIQALADSLGLAWRPFVPVLAGGLLLTILGFAFSVASLLGISRGSGREQLLIVVSIILSALPTVGLAVGG